MTGEEITSEAFRMFEKWREMFAPKDFDGDVLALAMLYIQAPWEQLAEAARAAGLKPPSST